jgi:hypothetical protein
LAAEYAKNTRASEMIETISAAMLMRLTVPSASAEDATGIWEAADTDAAGVRAGAGLLTRGCVCCILTVAFGRAGLAVLSLGSVIRAVSFFG